LFEQIRTGEFREVFFHMDDTKIYNGEDGKEEGLWERRYFVPQMAVDTVINAESSRDFVEKTGRKKGTLGDIWDASSEASEKREKVMGKDFTKEKYLDTWRNTRKRKDGSVPKHSLEIPRQISITAE
jgi:hypothetical protein